VGGQCWDERNEPMNRSTDTAADHRIDLEPPGSAEDGFDEAAA